MCLVSVSAVIDGSLYDCVCTGFGFQVPAAATIERRLEGVLFRVSVVPQQLAVSKKCADESREFGEGVKKRKYDWRAGGNKFAERTRS